MLASISRHILFLFALTPLAKELVFTYAKDRSVKALYKEIIFAPGEKCSDTDLVNAERKTQGFFCLPKLGFGNSL